MDAGQFIWAMLAIVVIDIVLAGDNAIVIALAARALPAHLQKRAILWGAVGAIGVRSLMTIVVVWLLQIPGLLLAGGAALVWIAYRLLQPEDHGADGQHPAAVSFWGALRTIVIADAVMGLDNVLAVAGAAHGSYLLVVVGLAISVPIVIWGSALVLKMVERFPAVVYLGAAVLLWTAAKMIVGEPWLKSTFAQHPVLVWAVFATMPLVLWLAFVRNHRHFESRIHARLTEFAALRPTGASSATTLAESHSALADGDKPMLKVLVPVDGSDNAMQAVRHAIAEYQKHHELQVHLLNVQPRFSRHVARFVSGRDRDAWHTERANAAMAEARTLLRRMNVPHEAHLRIGDRAAEICRAATHLGVDHIVMGTARKNSVTRMLEDSVTNGVLQSTPVPVEVIAGKDVSIWERWGVPVGAAAGIGSLLWVAID